MLVWPRKCPYGGHNTLIHYKKEFHMEKTGTSQTSRALTVRVLTYLDRLYPRMRHTFERELHIRHGVFARA